MLWLMPHGTNDRDQLGPEAKSNWKLLIGFSGGATLQERANHPGPYEPRSNQTTGSTVCSGEFRLAHLLDW